MPFQVEFASILSGFLFGSISIVSIGPNNVMLMREGLVGRHPVLLATTVWLSYLVLLTAGVFIGAALPPSGTLVQSTLSWLGVLLLVFFGGLMLAPPKEGSGNFIFGDASIETPFACARRGLAVVWINPLTYLEMFLIPAGLAAHLQTFEQRAALLAGMVLAFALNCFGYVLCAKVFAPFAREERTRRVLDQIAGAAMIIVATILGYANLTALSPPSGPSDRESVILSTR